MKILVVGNGGREHAIVWVLAKSGKHELFAAPGNPGTGTLAENIPISTNGIEELVAIAEKRLIDLVIAGPEAPLVDGLADSLDRVGIPCLGPVAAGAELEGSKWFAKEIMKDAGVPTADGRIFSDTASAMEYIGTDASGFVIKADGLAAGKGVFLPETIEETENILNSLFAGSLGSSGDEVVIEERLVGEEVSVLAICSGTQSVILPPSSDHKRLGEGDTGPNTGGMGAICPPHKDCPNFEEEVTEKIIQPVLGELASRGIDYRGVLYAGLMITDKGPRVLEFNVRFGDPETQVVLPMLEDDLADLCYLAATGGKLPTSLNVKCGACAGVVLASGGYPGSYSKGIPIDGLEDVGDAIIFHAGTATQNGKIVTAGGRVLSVIAHGNSLDEALNRAYNELEKITFDKMYYRRDIGRVK